MNPSALALFFFVRVMNNIRALFSLPTHIWPRMLHGCFGGALLFSLSLAWAQPAPAGTVIRNQAAALVEGQVYLSNVVETVVRAVCVPSLSPDGTVDTPAQYAMVPAGGYAYFAYLLRNSGNDRFVFNLSWAQDGALWTPSTVRFYHDANGNGRLDSGEGELNAVALAAGEEIRLILAVQTPLSASGRLHISPVATCPDGHRDENNHSRISIGTGPALNLFKAANPSLVGEGEEVLFTFRILNLGNAVALGPIYVSDNLDTPTLRDLRYVPGSASAAKGNLEYSDGATWSNSEPGEVRGIRLVLGQLEAGEEALFSFRMRVEAGAVPGSRQNLGTLQSGADQVQAVALFQIAPRYSHALGPRGQPLAAGEADRQIAWVWVGQPYCFAHTLRNTGNAADSYTLSAVGLPDGIALSYRLPNGISLPSPSPIVLTPGAELDFEACLPGLSPGTAPFEFTLLARSQTTGATDPTVDQIAQIFDLSRLVLRKESQMGPEVGPGERVVYTLRIENPLPLALNDVQIEDRLDALLEFVSASDGGTYDPSSRMVRWNLTLPAEGVRTLTLETRVNPAAPQGATIVNQFALRNRQIANPLLSNSVELSVQTSSLLLEKQIRETKVTVGDRLTYTLTLVNAGRVALTVRLEDTPSPGLAYVPGSASLGEPIQQEGRLIWENLTLAPGERKTLTYQMRVLPGAPETLINRATAQGATGGGPVVARATASAVVRLERGVLASPHNLVGRVFLDADRDGRYTPGVDVPLPGARVVLGHGLQATTDAEGRYGFRNIDGGWWALLLEPASAPFKPRPHPEAQGEGYRHRVWVEGLTQSDFPLELPQGLVQALRETTLAFGPLTVHKKLLPLPQGVRVVLELKSLEALPELTLTDPLPQGGERVFYFERFEGQETLTYDLPGPAFLTDPQVRWRYP